MALCDLPNCMNSLVVLGGKGRRGCRGSSPSIIPPVMPESDLPQSSVPISDPPSEPAALPEASPEVAPPRARLLDEEEYIEQAYFFQTFIDRLDDNRPAQDILRTVGEEILATTKLPIAIEYLAGEAERRGRIAPAMTRLGHYFTPFQTFVIDQAERDDTKFPFRTALLVLQREVEYRGNQYEPIHRGRTQTGRASIAQPAGLFTYQFESIARNRLGYKEGLTAMAGDPMYYEPHPTTGQRQGAAWREWMQELPRRIGTVDFADLIYSRSEQFVLDTRRARGEDEWTPPRESLFGVQEGRIAKANRNRDPLYMFAALQRQLGYPEVPRVESKRREKVLDPEIEFRFQRLEAKLLMLEQEQKGGIDLSQFTEQFGDLGES